MIAIAGYFLGSFRYCVMTGWESEREGRVHRLSTAHAIKALPADQQETACIFANAGYFLGSCRH